MTSLPPPDPQTPLTDAFENERKQGCAPWVTDFDNSLDFARTLERDLTATRQQLEEMRKERDEANVAISDLKCGREFLRSQLTALQSRLDRAEGASAKLEQMEKALKFYANHDNWKASGPQWDQDPSAIKCDGGKLASAALASSLNTEKKT